MAHEVQIEELLAAYLADDLSPEERSIVECRLALDSGLKAQLNELRPLLAALKQGRRQVTPEMLAEFKERISLFLSQQSGKVPPSQLLAANAVGDLDEQERHAVGIFLNENPQARKELESLKVLSAFLDKGRKPISAQVTGKLAQRLGDKIPASALASALPKATETVSLRLQNQTATATSTVRIYAAKENPWRARLTAIAAAVALAVGAFFAVQTLKKGSAIANGEHAAPRMDNPENALKNIDRMPLDQQELRELQPREGPNIPNPANTPPKSTQNPGIDIPNPDKEVPPRLPTGNTERSTIPDDDQKSQRGPSEFDKLKGPPTSPDDTNAHEIVLNTEPVARPPVLPPNFSPVPPVGGQSQDPNDNKQANTGKIEPVFGELVAATVADGNVQATTPDNVQLTVQPKQQLPSGTTITTGSARVAFILPGDGSIQIHRKSIMTATLNNLDTTIALAAGEFHYKSPPGGTLTVNARNIVVSRATGSVMVQIANGNLITNVLSNNTPSSALVQNKGNKKSTPVPAGKNATAKLDGDDAITVGTADTTDLDQDLPLPGDSSQPPLVPTSTKGKSKSGDKTKTHSHNHGSSTVTYVGQTPIQSGQ